MYGESSELPQSFRSMEAAQLFDWIRAGESASVVGISGVGKSNLFNHLLDSKVQEAQLGSDARNFIFVRVNFHYLPDLTDRAIYSLILEQLERLAGASDQRGLTPDSFEYIRDQHSAMLNAGQDRVKVQLHFKRAIHVLLADPNRRLILLCDQFDDVYREADRNLLSSLRGLREDYKYRLSYVTFTRDTLPGLAATDAKRDEFYELVASNVMGLKPYGRTDAMLLLRRVADRHRLALDDALGDQLFRLTGGHAGLLRAAYLAAARSEAAIARSVRDASRTLLNVSTIEAECDKIWSSLSVEEQRALKRRLQRQPADDTDRKAEDRLRLKGVLAEQDVQQLFSPVFALHIEHREASWERSIFLDERTRQVWVFGQPAPRLTTKEFQLFELLYGRPGELVLKDELIEAGWPGAKGGVSDETLNAVIARIRKKIEPEDSRFLETVRGQGYMLKVDS